MSTPVRVEICGSVLYINPSIKLIKGRNKKQILQYYIIFCCVKVIVLSNYPCLKSEPDANTATSQ
jgi:hypothetical protein